MSGKRRLRRVGEKGIGWDRIKPRYNLAERELFEVEAARLGNTGTNRMVEY